MTRISIDDQTVDVPEGTTILDAARKIGIDIPALCHRDDIDSCTSCMVCVVRVKGQPHLTPACATRVTPDMVVESETAEIHAARKMALELLLGNHRGDCIAPCQSACPAGIDIPRVLRLIAGCKTDEAAALLRTRLPLTGIVGRICPAPCEKACRRRAQDAPVGICLLHRFVAEETLSRVPLPSRKSATGKRIAVIGAGVTGLAATWELLQCGHECHMFDEKEKAGGMIRIRLAEESLPRNILEPEIERIFQLGAEWHPGVTVGQDITLVHLRHEFDAILVATGNPEYSTGLGADMQQALSRVPAGQFQVTQGGVFAAGDALRQRGLAVHSVAQGVRAAADIDRFLSQHPPKADTVPFTTRVGALRDGEIAQYMQVASPESPVLPSRGIREGYTQTEALREAKRCLHCDCRKTNSCLLRKYSAMYAAQPSAHPTERPGIRLFNDHPDIVFEPGKCIHCGICSRIALREGEPVGLGFQGRGFDGVLAAPFGESISQALTHSALICADACPTGALARRSNED